MLNGDWKTYALGIMFSLLMFLSGLYVNSVASAVGTEQKINAEQALVLANHGERLATQEERSQNVSAALTQIMSDIREIRNATVPATRQIGR